MDKQEQAINQDLGARIRQILHDNCMVAGMYVKIAPDGEAFKITIGMAETRVPLVKPKPLLTDNSELSPVDTPERLIICGKSYQYEKLFFDGFRTWGQIACEEIQRLIDDGRPVPIITSNGIAIRKLVLKNKGDTIDGPFIEFETISGGG